MGDALDPDTVERVLRRAQELSADAVDQADARPGVVDEAVLVDAAAEAGIDPGAVRQALALERLEVPVSPARSDRVLGAAAISRTRVVDAPADEVLDRLDTWLTSSGRLVAVRRADGTVEWMPRTGIWASLHRFRRPPLTPTAQEADRLVADVTPTGAAPIDPPESHEPASPLPLPSPGGAPPPSGPSSVVRLTLDRRSERRATANTGLAVSGAGAVGTVAALTVLVPGFLVVSIPAVGWGAWLATGGRRRADAMGDELDKLLDVVAAGDRPPSMTDRLRRRPPSDR